MRISSDEAKRFLEAVTGEYMGFKSRSDIIPFDEPPVHLSRAIVQNLAEQKAHVSWMSLEDSKVIVTLEGPNLRGRPGTPRTGLDLGRLREMAAENGLAPVMPPHLLAHDNQPTPDTNVYR